MIAKIFKITPVFAILYILCCLGCAKIIEIDPPVSQLSTETVFADSATAVAALSGIYSKIERQVYGGYNSALGMYTDELSTTGANNQYMLSTIPAADDLAVTIWNYFYNTIYQCNSVLEQTSRSTNLSPQVKIKLAGEARFLRAFAYLNLLNTYGHIPLVLQTDVNLNSVITQSDSTAVYQQITMDLLQSKRDLNTTYTSANRSRVNKWAAAALLARVYLYQHQWANAEQEATEVLHSGQYGLNINLSDVFHTSSNETLFQLDAPGGFTQGMQSLIPAAGGLPPEFQITQDLYNAFETGDKRKQQWIASAVTPNGIPYLYQSKYKNGTGASGEVENLVVLRLAEVYLIRAEARNEQNKVTGDSGASSDLNMVRTRAGLPGTSAITSTLMRMAIENERRTEFFVEWGHRFADLKRTGRINAVLGAYKSTWKSTAYRWPIPYREIQINARLIQNAGY